MTATLFQEWLEWFDIRLQKTKEKNMFAARQLFCPQN